MADETPVVVGDPIAAALEPLVPLISPKPAVVDIDLSQIPSQTMELSMVARPGALGVTYMIRGTNAAGAIVFEKDLDSDDWSVGLVARLSWGKQAK